MNKEEAKQYLRNQIDSSIIMPDKFYKNRFYLCYNKSYIRALKLSKITGKPVNKDNFKGGEKIFKFDSEYKEFWYLDVIAKYLDENYSNDYSEQKKIITDVINDYEEYKGYDVY